MKPGINKHHERTFFTKKEKEYQFVGSKYINGCPALVADP